jgi:hypothetical protein
MVYDGAVGEDRTRGNSAGESGWVTTQVAAEARGVEPRTVRLREERDRLRAELEAERSKGFWTSLFCG